uniref:Uncharacterized protein n=1 Tax=Yersinia enterocolitica TaxID=630 RepID=B0RKX0_YEREN|nr:hypothetical protein [Yersinia enterocolitica]
MFSFAYFRIKMNFSTYNIIRNITITFGTVRIEYISIFITFNHDCIWEYTDHLTSMSRVK